MKKISILLLLLCFNLNPRIHAQEYYQNPILAGWYPDPAITDDGNGNYYMVHSTFAFFPGIPIFHSTDLVNWEQIGNVLDRPEQLNLEGFGVSRAIFAPDISYNNGTFYVTCTMVDGKGNFLVTAKDPAGPWSNPIWLPEVKGIDPGLFFDENKTYLVYNSDAPNNEPQYSGHRTIRMVEFDKENLEVISDNRILVNGGVDISTKPVWAEGPRIYKENGYYYLMTAEGGTAVNHSEMIYRNKNIDSEFIPYKNNPILTQRQLDPNRNKPITSAGHADLIQDKNGDWYGVFLAVRPYEDDYYNTGRETFMAPVKWENDWPVFDLGGEKIKYQYPLPEGTSIEKDLFPLNGNFSFRREFDKDSLGLSWLFLRTPLEKWYKLENSKLILKTRSQTVEGTSNPSFIGHRQQHLNGEVSISLDFKAESEDESAGMLAFQNESHYYYLHKTLENGKPIVALAKGTENGSTIVAKEEITINDSPLLLKIEFNKDRYNFYYATTKNNWERLAKDIDGKYLSTKVVGGFVGVTLGMYTTSNGEKSDNSASFNWFEYTGKDEIYNEMD
ncbi:glycoside hydrolase family 43 protein [Zunongwangia sp. H14]|uniref:glycoside hydrolase family 43 protein n=1 Tax=Zunongwangia sp. H14 TaxID=3240792 RepID=UPI0035689B8E